MNMNKLKPFPFWCSKVLPLVYDDSLSYYELLCKVVNYLNNTMQDVVTLGDAFEQLKEWCEHYFDTLDVEPLVNERIDKMIESGEFGEIIVKAMVEVEHFRVTPYMFGAKGDGTNDDTQAFKKCLEYKNIYIPTGEFILTQNLVIPDDTDILGDGVTLSFLEYSGDVTTSFLTLGNNVHIYGLYISQEAQTESETYSTVVASGKSKIVIDSCQIVNGAFRNLTLVNCRDCVVRSSEFAFAKKSAGLGINGTVNHAGFNNVIDCYAHDNALDGFISSDGYTAFINCTATDNGTTNNAAGFFLNENAHENSLIECHSYDNTGIGIEIAGTAKNVRISSCDVVNNGSDGIEVRNAVSPIIVNNYVANNESPRFNGQISVSNDPNAESGGVIDGNVIDGFNKTTYGIYAPNAKNVVGTNYIRNVITQVNAHWHNRLNADDGYLRAYAERFELDSDGSRFATLNNRGDGSYVEIGVNKPLSLQSTVAGEGLARIRYRNNLQSTAASTPQNGDIHYTSTGLKIYVNGTWKDILFD